MSEEESIGVWKWRLAQARSALTTIKKWNRYHRAMVRHYRAHLDAAIASLEMIAAGPAGTDKEAAMRSVITALRNFDVSPELGFRLIGGVNPRPKK